MASHHLAQLFPQNIITITVYDKVRYCVFIITKQASITYFIFMLFSHSLHTSFLWVILYWNVCIFVCLEQMKGILKIVFQNQSSSFLKLMYIFFYDEIAFGK